MAECPTIIGDPAVGFTAQAYELYTGFATQAVFAAQQAVADLQKITLDPIAFNVSFGDVAVGTYKFPVRPKDPNIEYQGIADPADPPVVTVQQPIFDAAPRDTTQAPVIPVRTEPNVQLPDPVGPGPTLETLVIPDAPVAPDFPVLTEIVIPPPIEVSPFAGIRPTLNFGPPGNSFAFTPEEYTSALLDKVSLQISTMLDGGTGLPPSAIAAIRARAFAATDIEETRNVQQVMEDFGGMGLTDNGPNASGVLTKRVKEQRQKSQNDRSALTRDMYIADQQEVLLNLRFAVQQGVTIETAKFTAHVQFMQVALDAAKAAMQFTIEIFNGQVSLFNAEQQAYATDAAVFRDTVQAEVSLFQSQIEAQKLVSETNLQEVQVFTARIGAAVQIFTAEIEGARAKALNNSQLLEQYRAQIENATEEIRAYEARFNAFTALVNSDQARARLYETTVNAQATRVASWAKQQDTKIAAANLNVATADLNLRGWHGSLEKYVAKTQAEIGRVDANVRVQAGGIELYKADASIQQVASAVQQRTVELAIERERGRVDTALKQADLQINQLEKNVALLLEKFKTIASTEAQLAASALSAMSFHAGVTSSRSQSQACNTEFQFLGSA